jgi:hypothetical protein
LGYGKDWLGNRVFGIGYEHISKPGVGRSWLVQAIELDDLAILRVPMIQGMSRRRNV